MMNNIKLVTPRKPVKIPEKLVYQSGKKNVNYYVDEFKIFSTRNTNGYGVMRCSPTVVQDKLFYNRKALFISLLTSHPAEKGFGSSMIDFAKKYSEQVGCGGYLSLYSSSGYQPNKIPHIFYRKQGFTTLVPLIDAKLDMFIRKNKYATHNDFECMRMYYLPENCSKHRKNNIFHNKYFAKISNLIKRLFKT